jgi:hypothetical protein
VAESFKYQRNSDFIYRNIADEAVLVPIHQNVADMDCIYTLNSVGAFLWERLEQPVTQSELKAAILNEYAAEPEVLVNDIERFLAEMLTINALRKV